MAETLLLVDDEEKVLEFMSSFLIHEGFQVFTARNGQEALSKAVAVKPALVVLDWMMPEMNGLDVCRELRKRSQVGIIMVTAKTDEMDKIIGLEVGADDYMTKPFSLRELLARIRSVLRRLQGSPAADEQLVRDDLVISSSQCRVWKQGAEISMTPTEFKLLLTLAVKPGIVYSRLQLLKAALDDDFLNVERTVDAHISRLRKKIEDDISNPKYIQTVYGFGYRFGGQS
ncbi:DNA-binding response regulator, OmpR family, contains REC and winged-helix (wHTH) domain [Paenibacillus catalpae]|uniref:DNA-binding response regulator, OmpR family, contains REC and winged-helix (WHTH) domain n=1 Tax=Paenibacillus catalpae TaxID=1045775 RepID=A0A1I2DIN1_9BACL|nr:response regulator transcription factor [Paenibacillus catalpae]SFE80289.1 DNA-binding response regulator, OmpR family, contains REC and winged-helix (wHTH) domain [Paenibacillus catalpae]